MKIPTCIALPLILAATPLAAITFCHDFVIYALLGRDSNGVGMAQPLRDLIAKLGYTKYTTLTSKVENQESYLRKGDIVIFGESHSGLVVDDKGNINHYLQDPMRMGKGFSPQEARVQMNTVEGTPLFMRGWTITRIREHRAKILQRDGAAPVGTPVTGPATYKDLNIEIWRPGTPVTGTFLGFWNLCPTSEPCTP